MRNIVLIASCVTVFSGCSTISPERSIASELVGQNVSEAVKRLSPYMGQPRYITVSPENPEDTIYEWVSNERHYDLTKPSGTYTDTSGGYVRHVETYTTERKYTACRVSMTVSPKGTISYHETKGCGFMGLGNTGWLHKVGIN